MPLELVNPDPRYSKVHLIEPAPLGYLHLAADVQAPHRPGPVLRRSRDKHQLLGVLKWQAKQVAQLDTVERVTVYDAIAFTPPAGDIKNRPMRPAWFDVAVLVETGLDNSTLLAPLEGEESDYMMINHARWDHSLPLFMARQLPKRTFRSYMLANLRAHHLTAMPVLYRLA